MTAYEVVTIVLKLTQGDDKRPNKYDFQLAIKMLADAQHEIDAYQSRLEEAEAGY